MMDIPVPFVRDGDVFEENHLRSTLGNVKVKIDSFWQGKWPCPICSRAVDKPFRPCESCRAIMLHVPGDSCSVCGIDLAGSHDPCLACREQTFTALESIVSLGPWVGPLREWVSIYKFEGETRLAPYLTELLQELIESRWPGIPVIPVPPRRIRVFEKGFDPVGFLAHQLARRGVLVRNVLCRQGRQTQKTLNRADRLSGQHLRYKLKNNCQNKIPRAAILLDDVMTTGATLQACARILRDAKVQSVYGVVLCRD